jgi:general secretion pathway protein H
MVRTPTSITGIRRSPQRGFTLVEIVAAITVAGLVLAIAVPQSISFYQSLQYRSAVRETIGLLNSARYAAVAQGVSRDVLVSPSDGVVAFGDERAEFADNVELAAHSAKEVNRDGVGIIRFYPDGGASGGGIDITRGGGHSVSIAVDWLVGRVTVDFGDNDD